MRHHTDERSVLLLMMLAAFIAAAGLLTVLPVRALRAAEVRDETARRTRCGRGRV